MLLSKCDKRLQGRVVEGHIRRREYWSVYVLAKGSIAKVYRAHLRSCQHKKVV